MPAPARFSRSPALPTAAITPLLLCALLAGCGDDSAAPAATGDRTVSIQRTTHGVAHIEAPDYEALGYGVAYAHAEDNVCQTANHLVTVRGERSRYFGADGRGLLGLRVVPNEQIDIFIRAHMDDEELMRAAAETSDEAQALARGYVDGYNRYLADHDGDLPEACAGKPWVAAMTTAEYLRIQELTMVQIGVAMMADAMLAAAPPAAAADTRPAPGIDEAIAALAPYRLQDPGLGSNGWAFGADVTTNGRGVLLGNPHFPWTGTNRFWQMHLTIPGKLDVMGASIGHTGVVQIGFNKDVAWTHTVSTGKRFTLHELDLVPGEPTRYRLDGREVAMQPVNVTYEVRGADGAPVEKTHTVWQTGFGPVVVIPDAGLGWSAEHAYALQDANVGNLRAFDIWVGFNRAGSVGDMQETLGNLGVPWVNTIAADRHGDAMFADVSVVPDVDAAHLERCAPSEGAARLFRAAGLVVLDGSRSDCNWNRDADSPVPGILPMERMPVAVRRDWVQNSNDSYWLSNPAIDWPAFSPLIGPTNSPIRVRTRAGLYEIRQRLAGEDDVAPHAKVGIGELQDMLFRNRNHAAHLVLDDLLAACGDAQGSDVRAACDVLGGWERRNNIDSRGAHLFREWWRTARRIDGIWGTPFDPAEPATTPRGLAIDEPAVREQALAHLRQAVATVRDAGFALDAILGDVQVRSNGEKPVGLHGGDELEGVLNKLETPGMDTLSPEGYRADFGSSYIQTVTFDENGPVAEAMLTYGQSTDPASPWYFDQLALYAAKRWPALPFHPDEIANARIGEPQELTLD
ncbi:MAG: acylase [Woeseiaceae bacterium]|nr:acylase [Woeseiaceae bacterium]